MVIHDLSFLDPQENLSFDEQMLHAAESAAEGESLRFWESASFFVVLGRTCKEQDDVHSQNCARDEIPVLRRSSGGGTVLQGPGCLNFALVLRKDRDPALVQITASYRFILEKILLGLQQAGVSVGFRPICDLVLLPGEMKFSGNAQKRGRDFILHHGTLLYDFPLEKVERYLKVPKKMPDYRQARDHAAFVANLPLGAGQLRDIVSKAFA